MYMTCSEFLCATGSSHAEDIYKCDKEEQLSCTVSSFDIASSLDGSKKLLTEDCEGCWPLNLHEVQQTYCISILVTLLTASLIHSFRTFCY